MKCFMFSTKERKSNLKERKKEKARMRIFSGVLTSVVITAFEKTLIPTTQILMGQEADKAPDVRCKRWKNVILKELPT